MANKQSEPIKGSKPTTTVKDDKATTKSHETRTNQEKKSGAV